MNESFLETIRNCDVVSFDVFDTLLIRPFIYPTDVFHYMESILENRDGFAQARVKAETKARKTRPVEITLNDIYSVIDDEYNDLSDNEVEFETSLIAPNPHTTNLLNMAVDSGKEVILTSDMYLPKKDVEGMLGKCGILGFNDLYLSSEYGMTKHDGSLFRHILSEKQIRADSMVHIGDNVRSDLRIPSGMGIRCIHIDAPIRRYLDENRRSERFYRKTRGLDRSIIVAMDMLHCINAMGYQDDSDKYYNLGFRYGGPLAYAYAEHLGRNIPEGSLALFASRDGYSTMRVFENLFPDRCKTRYIHAQRLISHLTSDSKLPYGIPENRESGCRHTTAVMKSILNSLSEDLGITSVPDGCHEITEMYYRFLPKIDHLRHKKHDEYSSYIRNICKDPERIDLIDSTTKEFTSQKLLESILEKDVIGHYMMTMAENKELEYSEFHRRHGKRLIDVNVPEYLLCSPEPPLSGWSGDAPTYMPDPPPWEIARMEAYPKISDGEFDYSTVMKSIFSAGLPELKGDSVLEWALIPAMRDNPYRNLLDDVMWASSPDHSNWRHLIPRPTDILGMLLDRL